MKTVYHFLLTGFFIASWTHASPAPDFEQIFREIKSKTTVSESIGVRKKYLAQMRNLRDFDRLTDVEVLQEGETYFNSYLKAISDFIVTHVQKYILDMHSLDEQDVYTFHVLSKAYDESAKEKLLRYGLVYVQDCEDFQRYASAAQANDSFYNKHVSRFCVRGGGGYYPGQPPFEIISNTILYNGEYKTILLFGRMYVSKLYISAVGYNGSSGYFDVMVNGDIKGTIYVPGRDPSYIVNIADYTSSIQLRALDGSTFIQSIKVQP